MRGERNSGEALEILRRSLNQPVAETVQCGEPLCNVLIINNVQAWPNRTIELRQAKALIRRVIAALDSGGRATSRQPDLAASSCVKRSNRFSPVDVTLPNLGLSGSDMETFDEVVRS